MFLRVTVNVFYILNDVFVLILKLQFLTRQKFFFSWQHKKGKIFILQRNTVYVKDLFDDILKNIEAEKNIKNYLIEGEDVNLVKVLEQNLFKSTVLRGFRYMSRTSKNRNPVYEWVWN